MYGPSLAVLSNVDHLAMLTFVLHLPVMEARNHWFMDHWLLHTDGE